MCKLAHDAVPTSTGADGANADVNCKARGKMTASTNKASSMSTDWANNAATAVND